MEAKVDRQRELVELLETKAFRSQGQVVRAMQDKGFTVTQPSISRDFRELGVVKMGGRYLAVDKPSVRALHERTNVNPFSLITAISTAGPNLLVVTTQIGAANVVAAAVDNSEIREVVGTIAGDDTLFVATSGELGQERVTRTLRSQTTT